MSPRLEFAIETAYRAGRSTMSLFQAGTPVDYKSDDTPVTAADKGAERLIREAIGRAYPDDDILGEEEGGAADSERRWVVDPIDGTKSFVSGVPLYATLLSFEDQGEPQLGVCYFPALNVMAYAEVGHGAFVNGRAMRVSRKALIEQSTLACGGLGSMVRYGRMEGFLDLTEKARVTRTWGDAYGHYLVASGQIEAMVDPIVNRWDISPMAVIVREAGGLFTDFRGRALLSDEAVSSNGHIHDAVLEPFRR